MTTTDSVEVYNQLISLLVKNEIAFREVEHEPEGRTEIISQIRGNKLSQAAKAMVIMVKIGKTNRVYYLAVVPGDARINLEKLKALCGGTHVMFAPEEIAKELTGCVMGAVPPFSFHKDLKLVVDSLLLENEEIVFNAGRLDRSLFLPTDAYIKIANPMLEKIAKTDN